MQVFELRDADKSDWDGYVQHAARALPYHLVGWKEVMEKTYGYRSHYLLARDGERIEGVAPLFEIRSRILGDSLTTLPGGLCAESQAAAEALIERAKEITRRIDADYFAIRDSRQKWNAGLEAVANHCSMICDLPSDVDVLWKKLDKRLRRHIRIGHESDLETSLGGEEHLGDFYAVLSAFLRDVGTPVFSRAFLRNIADVLGQHLLIACVRLNGELVGAYNAFMFKDTIFGAWGGSLHKYFDLRPNHVLYWRYMEYGCEHGFEHMDLGRSLLDSGHYRFKKGWGARPEPLYQLYFLNGPEEAPDVSSRMETDDKYQIFVRLWRRLPVPVTRWLGPYIRRHVPFG